MLNSLRIIVLASLASCTQALLNVSPDVSYQKNLMMTVNGETASGVMVIPKASRYDLTVTYHGSPELIRIGTCHREIIVDKSELKSSSFKTQFVPISLIESDGYCPINVGVFDKEGLYAWGLIEIRNESMKAKVFCNGKTTNELGVALCQSRTKLVQSISFDTQVKVSQLGTCSAPYTADNKTFKVETSDGICIYLFSANKSYFRFTTYGYTDILYATVRLKTQPSDQVNKRHPTDEGFPQF